MWTWTDTWSLLLVIGILVCFFGIVALAANELGKGRAMRKDSDESHRERLDRIRRRK